MKNLTHIYQPLDYQNPPENGREIVYYLKRHVFDSIGFEIQYGDADVHWEEIDEDGDPTGTCFWTDEDIDSNEFEVNIINPLLKFTINVGGYTMEEGDFWMYTSDYFDAFDEATL